MKSHSKLRIQFLLNLNISQLTNWRIYLVWTLSWLHAVNNIQTFPFFVFIYPRYLSVYQSIYLSINVFLSIWLSILKMAKFNLYIFWVKKKLRHYKIRSKNRMPGIFKCGLLLKTFIWWEFLLFLRATIFTILLSFSRSFFKV